MKDRRPIDLKKLAQEATRLDEPAVESDEPSRDKKVELWTDEFSASGEKNDA